MALFQEASAGLVANAKNAFNASPVAIPPHQRSLRVGQGLVCMHRDLREDVVREGPTRFVKTSDWSCETLGRKGTCLARLGRG